MKVEKIMCSAIWIKDSFAESAFLPNNLEYGFVICGYRHHNCIDTLRVMDYKKEKLKYFGYVQGFLTNNDRFVDRIEAKKIAESAGQLLEGCSKGKELFSEDVWLINC